MEAQRKIQLLVCGNPCWSGSVALEEVLSEARQRQRRDPHAMCTKTLKVTRQHKFTSRDLTHTHTHTLAQKEKGVAGDTKRHTLIVIGWRKPLCKEGIFSWKCSKCVTFVEGEFNVLSSQVLVMSSHVFWKGGYLRQESTRSAKKKKKPRRRPKQKVWKKCSVSSGLQNAPGV